MRPRNARFWKGEIEECDVVMVHPRCNNVVAIEKAYALAGRHVEPWNLPDKDDLPSTQTVLTDGMWKGQDVIIVAGGPSLKGFDWNRLDECGCKVIAINRAYETVPNPSLVYGMDNRFFTWANNGEFGGESLSAWQAIQCPIICSTVRPTNGPRGVHVNRSQDPNSQSLRTGVYCGGNSGMGAIHLCSLLGARRVYLLGYDCLPSPQNKTVHFHDGYKDKQDGGVYRKFISTFNAMAGRMAARLEVINCNPDSGVTAFSFGDLPDGPLNPKPEDIPHIVCYVTPNYKAVFNKHLKPGLEKYGLQYTLVERPSCGGDWRKNASAKATVIKEQYAIHGAGGLVWLDADASIERFPVMFAGLRKRPDVDFAAHWLNNKELISGALYFGPGEAASRLVKKWARDCEAKPVKYTTGDQRHLQNIAEEFVCKQERLPGSYCKIFDRPEQAHITHPAIIQHQESRNHKRGPKHGNS